MGAENRRGRCEDLWVSRERKKLQSCSSWVLEHLVSYILPREKASVFSETLNSEKGMCKKIRPLPRKGSLLFFFFFVPEAWREECEERVLL